MATTMTGASNPNPSPLQQTLASNYIDFTSGAGNDWGQQYLPDLMEKEAEIFGNRTVSGFLEMVGAEEPMSSDQVVWSEQGRLHLAFKGNVDFNASGNPDTFVFTIVQDIDGNTLYGSTLAGVRKGDLVVMSNADTNVKGYVNAVATNTVGGQTVTQATGVLLNKTYTSGVGAVSMTDTGTADLTTETHMFVYGSEYSKGTTGRTEALKPQFKSYGNKPVIIKDMYEISGSDAAQIGWVEVSGEDGQNGYMWYLKSAGDTRSRFSDYCEMVLVEHELTDTDHTGAADQALTGYGSNTKIAGTEGLFAAIRSRGNVFNGLLDTAHGAGGANEWTSDHMLDDFDTILKQLDTQGAIEEYMVFCNRDLSLAVDEMLAGQSAYGAGGTSYGVFDNSEDMALNLGFNGFRRGSYDFYKTDWKYLNDKATRGGMLDVDNHIRGVLVPAGVTSVYDQTLGKNLKRPFLHVRYRASQMEDRRFKTWTTGAVGAMTNDIDAMRMNFLTERCLITQGANNFVLLEGEGDYS